MHKVLLLHDQTNEARIASMKHALTKFDTRLLVTSYSAIDDFPTIEYFLQFDAVLVSTGCTFCKFKEEKRKTLSEFVRSFDGRCVVMAFTNTNQSGYTYKEHFPEHPLEYASSQSGDNACTFTMVQPMHPILHQIVTFECSGNYRVRSSAHKDSNVIATWQDGEPLVAERVIHGTTPIVALNFYSISNEYIANCYNTNSDAERLIYNACFYVATYNKSSKRLQRLLFGKCKQHVQTDVQFVL